jgi:hypothetical protein
MICDLGFTIWTPDNKFLGSSLRYEGQKKFKSKEVELKKLFITGKQ